MADVVGSALLAGPISPTINGVSGLGRREGHCRGMPARRSRTVGNAPFEVNWANPRGRLARAGMPVICHDVVANCLVSDGRLVSYMAVIAPICLSRYVRSITCPTLPFTSVSVFAMLCRSAIVIKRGLRTVFRLAVGRLVSVSVFLAYASSNGRKGYAVLGRRCSSRVCIGSWR